MAMVRQKDGQGDLMVRWSAMPRSPGHVFYDRLQWVLIEGGFEAFAEASCRPYYAVRMGAPLGAAFEALFPNCSLQGYSEGIEMRARSGLAADSAIQAFAAFIPATGEL